MEAFLQLWPYSVVKTIGLWPVWQACGRKVIHVGYRTNISPLDANNKNYQNKQYHPLRRQRNFQLSKFFCGYLLVFMILVSVTLSMKKLYGNRVINPSRFAYTQIYREKITYNSCTLLAGPSTTLHARTITRKASICKRCLTPKTLITWTQTITRIDTNITLRSLLLTDTRKGNPRTNSWRTQESNKKWNRKLRGPPPWNEKQVCRITSLQF